MRDTTGRSLEIGDKVVVCHSGGTNQTLITGSVKSTSPKSVIITVENPGGVVDVPLLRGQEKRVSAPHKIFCYAPALPPATRSQIEASRGAMFELVQSI